MEKGKVISQVRPWSSCYRKRKTNFSPSSFMSSQRRHRCSLSISGLSEFSSHSRTESYLRPSSSCAGVAQREVEAQCFSFLSWDKQYRLDLRTYDSCMKRFWSFQALYLNLFLLSLIPALEYPINEVCRVVGVVSLLQRPSYPIDSGIDDPTENKPRLRRVLQDIHRSDLCSTLPRRPMTREILGAIYQILSTPNSGRYVHLPS